MASLNVKALQIIQRPPEDRSNVDVDLIVPWLRKKTHIVQGLETDAMKQILKNCEYMRAEKDEIIIEQGHQGDTLYIILTGSVSVYIDSSKTDEGETMTVPARTRIPPKDSSQGTREHTRQAATRDNARQGTTRENTRQGAAPDGSRKGTARDTTQRAPSTANGSKSDKNADQQASDEQPPRERTRSKATLDKRQASSTNTEKQVTRTATDLTAVKMAKSKARYGKFVVKFDIGKCFGEIALISEENIRNATIISDGFTEMLLIRKELYDSTLKEYQEREFIERREFVRRHPLFRNWAKRLQRLLEMSLVKEIYTFGAQMIRQGDTWNGLTFIQKGRARLLVEPARHNQQYSDHFPFATKNDIYEIEFNRPQRPPPEHPEEILRFEHIEIRRTEGYAAAERRRFQKEIPLCIVEEGEILGDIECIHNLNTHTVSAVCMAPTEVFVLTSKNIDRLITKKLPSTINTLRMEVETKLRNRLASKQGSDVFLYRHLLFKLTEEIIPTPRKVPDFGVGLNMKNMPDREALFQHLMHSFQQNRAEAVVPYTEGSVFLREKMREKARLRDVVKLNQGEKWARKQKKRHVRRPPSAKPRSIKHLKIALKKQEEGAQVIEREYLAREYRNLEQQVMKDFYMTALSDLSGTGDEEEGLHVICNRLSRAGRSLRSQPQPIRTTQSLPDIGGQRHLNRSQPATINSRLTSREKTFVTELNDRQSLPLQSRDASRSILGDKDKLSSDNIHVKNQENVDINVVNSQETPPMTGEEHQHQHQPPNNSLITELANDDTTRDVTKLPVNIKPKTPQTPPLNATSELVVAKEAVHMTSRAGTCGNSTSPGEDQWISDENAKKLHHLQGALQNRVTLAPEDPHYRDWETSDTSLEYLEERIRKFKIHRDPTFVRLPSLPRYQAGDDGQQPRPGGRVIIQRKQCNVASSQRVVANHSHVQHHVVHKVPDYDKLKHHKMLSHFALDDIREKWLQEHKRKQDKRVVGAARSTLS